jgi:hypothetical protein
MILQPGQPAQSLVSGGQTPGVKFVLHLNELAGENNKYQNAQKKVHLFY